MGNTIANRINRLFDYPVKRKPICYHRQEDFSSTGEFINEVEEEASNLVEYDRISNEFYSKLLAKRRQTKAKIDKARGRTNSKDLVPKYPAWDDMTISNLQSLYLVFHNHSNGLLEYDAFETILETLGDKSTSDIRMKKFAAADTDSDGYISYDEFLPLVYKFDGSGGKLAKLCVEASEKIKFIDSLSVGEQLEFGLF